MVKAEGEDALWIYLCLKLPEGTGWLLREEIPSIGWDQGPQRPHGPQSSDWISKSSYRNAMSLSMSLSPWSLETWCCSIIQHRARHGCLNWHLGQEKQWNLCKIPLKLSTVYVMTHRLHLALSELAWMSQEISVPCCLEKPWERLSTEVCLFANLQAGKDSVIHQSCSKICALLKLICYWLDTAF